MIIIKNLEDQNLMNSVLHKYYELGISQADIAKQEFISRASVCRIIKKALEQGFVTININYPSESLQKLDFEFRKYFDLDKIYIAPTYTDSMEIRLKETCKPALMDLLKYLTPKDTISIAWGGTIGQLAKLCPSVTNKKRCANIVPLDGYVTTDISSTHSSQILEQLANFFTARAFLLPTPLIVSTKKIADALKSDPQIKHVMQMAKRSAISITSVGNVDDQSQVYRWMNAFSKDEYEKVVSMGAVGIIAGRFYNDQGVEVCEEISERVLSLPLDYIKKKKIRVGVVVGSEKVDAIIGALRGKIFNRFYTDERTAIEVIEKVSKL